MACWKSPHLVRWLSQLTQLPFFNVYNVIPWHFPYEMPDFLPGANKNSNTLIINLSGMNIHFHPKIPAMTWGLHFLLRFLRQLHVREMGVALRSLRTPWRYETRRSYRRLAVPGWEKPGKARWFFGHGIYPIRSMYVIYGNIYHRYTSNVSIYTSTMDPMGMGFSHS